MASNGHYSDIVYKLNDQTFHFRRHSWLPVAFFCQSLWLHLIGTISKHMVMMFVFGQIRCRNGWSLDFYLKVLYGNV